MVLECGSLSHVETSGPVQGLLYVCNVKTMCCARSCAHLISPTLTPQYSSKPCDITTLPSTNNKSNLLWSSKILNMYVCTGIQGRIFAQLLQRRGFCVEGFYWTTTVRHCIGTIIKWQTIHIFLLKSLCLSVRVCSILKMVLLSSVCFQRFVTNDWIVLPKGYKSKNIVYMTW